MESLLVYLLLLALLSRAYGGCYDYPVQKATTILPPKNANKVFRIGAFGTWTTIPLAVDLMTFAVDYVNNRTDLLPDVLLELYVAQLNGSNANAMLAPQSLIQAYNVQALVGGIFSTETRIGQMLTTVYTNVPGITALPLSSILSDKLQYPHTFRVNPADNVQSKAIASLFVKYGWVQAMVLYTSDDFGTYGETNLQLATKDLNVTLYSNQLTLGQQNFSSNVQVIQSLVAKYNLKIFIIYTQAAEGGYIMDQLSQVGLGTKDQYIYLLSQPAATYLAVTSQPIASYYYGSIAMISTGYDPSDTGIAIRAAWDSYNITRPVGISADPAFSFYHIDAILLLAHCVDALIANGTAYENITGPLLEQMMKIQNFTGISGTIAFDKNQDRIGNFALISVTPAGVNVSMPVAIYDPASDTLSEINGVLTFNGNLTNPVDGFCSCLYGTCNEKDECICISGFTGPTCGESIHTESSFTQSDLIIVIVVPVVVVAIILLTAVKCIRWKQAKLVKNMAERQRSVINRKDIVLGDRIGRGASGEVFKGMMRGTEVAVKRLIASSTSAEVVREFELESAIMAGLRHPNIVLFMGSCFVAEQREMLLVMELADKGSLNDVIHNPRISLSRELCLHIAYQAAKGMSFLHQSTPPIIHRDLKSHNILMDSKWNARISDFGITKFKTLSKKNAAVLEEKSLGTIYWTAPEIFEGKEQSEASDCYAFGVVIWEMLHRKTPYDGREPMLVAMEVAKGATPTCSPDLDPSIKQLMMDCWAFNPDVRPSFEALMGRLKALMGSTPPTLPLEGYGEHSDGSVSVEAPSGAIFMVSTDVDQASVLWDQIPMPMLASMQLHNEVMRANIAKYTGYEVEFRGNGMFVAFSNLSNAVDFCFAVQKELVGASWPLELLAQPQCATKKTLDATIWSGLRVRMGIHSGVPNCEINHSTGRMSYSGPSVERVKKLLKAVQMQASILVTSAIMEQINKKGLKFTEEMVALSCGEMLDSARSKNERIYKVLPQSLAARNMDDSPTPSGPHSVIMVGDVEDIWTDDGEERPIPNSLSPRKSSALEVAHDELVVKEMIGKGAVGDFLHCIWDGEDVTAKILLNQKLEENDIMTLRARASVLSKMKHQSLLEFHGVCLDEGHLALIVEYFPHPNLPALLADASLPLPFPSKLKLARQIADGMLFVSNSEHDWVKLHFGLKSGNVLVEKASLEVKLCDLGQSNLKDLARTMTAVGTVAWTAPEILNGNAITPAISVYSFGIILWEILTRKVPYHTEHPVKVVSKIISGYRPAIPADCPPKYKDLMERCWNVEYERRPTWQEICGVLDSMSI